MTFWSVSLLVVHADEVSIAVPYLDFTLWSRPFPHPRLDGRMHPINVPVLVRKEVDILLAYWKAKNASDAAPATRNFGR